MDRREVFDLVAAHAFAETYAAFPCAWNVRPSALAFSLKAELVVVEQSLRWLVCEDFLRSPLQLNGDKDWTLFLTAKSFYVLDKLPASLKPEERLAAKLLQFIKNGSGEVAKDLVTAAVTAGVTAAFSAK